MSRLLAHMYVNYMILCGIFRGKPVNDNYSCVKPVKILYIHLPLVAYVTGKMLSASHMTRS